MKVQDPSLNEEHRAFFSFNLLIKGYPLDRESFMLSVNKTTGHIDMLMTPKLDAKILDDFEAKPLIPLEEAKEALHQVDAVLEWDKRYEMDEPIEKLIYRFRKRESSLQINCINATTGELILMKE